MTKTRRMALFAFDGCGLLDVAGPASVFGVANAIARRTAYDVRVVSPYGGLVATSCGMSIGTQAPKAVAPETVDTMLVVGGGQDALRRAIARSVTRDWLQRCVRRAARFGSVCSGAYILAELGELDGLRVATHWANCDDLAMQYPDLSVDRNALFVVSGKAWTSAGVSTGIDMALAMVEQDIGRPVADKAAKFMVLYARRPGYQSQFSEMLTAQISAGTPFADLINWLESRIAQPIQIGELASRSGLSERTFYRKFVGATGQTPAQFILNARLARAHTLLATDLPLKIIAAQIGIGSATRLSLAFERKFGLSPSTFRKVHHDISRSANGLREDVQRLAAPKQTIRPRRPRR
jgi:transcriptional regulator GlxA family with amidase domain